MEWLLILCPLVLAGLAAAVPSNRWRPLVLPLTGTVHLVLTVVAITQPPVPFAGEWLVLDPLGRVVLLGVSVLYFFCSWYAVGYLRDMGAPSNRVFTACMAGLLGLLSLVILAHHLGLMWVAIEGTTLVSAPLIYFRHTKLSIEATWKYLLVGSVGIALALLGTFFLAYSALEGGREASLSFDTLWRNAPFLSKPWLRAAFILLLVGYGTKMGLAPMHQWKPDTYGESPGVVGALFAGGIGSVAFLALLRVFQICQAAGEAEFASRLLLILGFLSMAVAGIFLIGQRDIKRLLAYSSVEHMGILALGLGLGKTAWFGTLFHLINNALTKGVLFLSAGTIQRAFGSKNTDQVRGAIRRVPLSAGLFLAGFLAITGSPPFAPFFSEFAILQGALASGQFLTAGAFLFLLLVVFVGMGRTVLRVVQGRVPPGTPETPIRDRFLTGAPVAALLVLVLALGIQVPEMLKRLLDEAVIFLGAQP